MFDIPWNMNNIESFYRILLYFVFEVNLTNKQIYCEIQVKY